MNPPLTSTPRAAVRYELRFPSLFVVGRGYAFPCDAVGAVDLGALGERGRRSYQHVRSAVGRELGMPTVRRVLPVAAMQ